MKSEDFLMDQGQLSAHSVTVESASQGSGEVYGLF